MIPRNSHTAKDKCDFYALKELYKLSNAETVKLPAIAHRNIPPGTTKKWYNKKKGIDGKCWMNKIDAGKGDKKKDHAGAAPKYLKLREILWKEYEIRFKLGLDVPRG